MIRTREIRRPKRGRSREYLRVIASKPRLGRIKQAVKREFILSDGQPILTRSVLERAYPRLRRFTDWHYLAARRALRHDAEVVARNLRGRGRPNLWAPKEQARCQSVAKQWDAMPAIEEKPAVIDSSTRSAN